MIGVFSVSNNIGKTFIGANIAAISGGKGNLTGIVELNRYYGSSSQYFHTDFYKNNNYAKNLVKAMDSFSSEGVKKNYLFSSIQNVFYLSMTSFNNLDDLYKMPEQDINKVIEVSEELFDVLILDLPANYLEPALMSPLMKVEKLINVLDDNIITLKKLKKYDEFFQKLALPRPETVINVVNKYEGIISEKIFAEELETMTFFKSSDIHFIPYAREIIEAGNLGEGMIIRNLGGSKGKKIFNVLKRIHQETAGGKIVRELQNC